MHIANAVCGCAVNQYYTPGWLCKQKTIKDMFMRRRGHKSTQVT